jgi:hypothetical protein
MIGGNFENPRIAIIGSCQVAGLAAAARAFLPGAEVAFWHVGVHPKDSDDELLVLLPQFDIVISQLSDWDGHTALRITKLRERGLPVFYLPVIVFPGFHPDMTYLHTPNGLVNGIDSDYHSIITASAFALDLPQWRVPDLFNAYVFAELGYFEVFDASKTALIANFSEAGIDLHPLLDRWLTQVGQFMYTINHPGILPLTMLCRLILAQAGCIDPDAPLPETVDDYLASQIVWPTHPALARRIGIQGDQTFLRRTYGLPEGQGRQLSLVDFVAASYRIYEGLDSETRSACFTGVIATACERLRGIVVR